MGVLQIGEKGKEARFGLTLRALVIGIGFLFLGSLWVKHGELVLFTASLTNLVPPVPALVALLFLVVLNPLLKNLRCSLSRSEILLIYAFLVIAFSMSSIGVVRLLFPCLTSLSYFATPQNGFKEYADYIPGWFAPKNPEIIRTMYEGADDEKVPWEAWLGPVLLWTLFFIVLWFTMFCLMVLVRKQWSEREKLSFPLLYLPLEMVEQGDNKGTKGTSFFGNPIMWTGFGISFLHNMLNIANAINPSVVSLGNGYDLGALFTEKPLDALRPLYFAHNPAVLGFGYLVSLEVSFSIWFFYFLMKLLSVGARVVGFERPGFPYLREQSSGVFIGLAIFLIWVSRGHIKEILKKAFFNDKKVDDSGEPLGYRWAVFGSLFGLFFIFTWCKVSGMPLWVTFLYFGLIFAFGFVYARLRAETGVPNMWAFPWGEHDKFLVNAFGSKAFVVGNNFSVFALWSILYFLVRGYFPELMAYQLENLKLAESAKIKLSHMAWVIILALIIGLGAAYWTHLTAYYQFGANILEGGTSEGGWRVGQSVSKNAELVSYSRMPKLPDYNRTTASGVGFIIALELVFLRAIFLKFPLHPFGYAVATSWGDYFWGPFLAVWVVKLVVLKLGGIKLYKNLIPGFIGLALGHYFAGGVIAEFLGFFGGEAFRRYHIG